ncbi:hypothetical protein DL96DRAFT_1818944 [Flagelloscypha sp. PMI_526]|nr:hypothetical protein DL96DRAFT_1818944 [Flagelloscypha sp. PMI_526]
MFLQFSRLPSELREYIVYWATKNKDDQHALLLVCKDFLTWTVPDVWHTLFIRDGYELEGILQTEIVWPIAAPSVRHLSFDEIGTDHFPLVCKLLNMTPNLSSVYFTLEGNFTLPDSIELPKLRKVMVAGPKSEDGSTCHIHLPSKIVQQLTHFAYIVQVTHISTHAGNGNFDDLVRWLKEPLESLTHFCLTLEDNWAIMGLWKILIRDTKEKVLPLLPYKLRVFHVHGETNMGLRGAAVDRPVVGQVDRRIVVADIDLGEYFGPAWLAPLFQEYVDARMQRIKGSIQFMPTDPLDVWVLAEEFSCKEDGKIRAFFGDSDVFLRETVAFSDNPAHEVGKLFGER